MTLYEALKISKKVQRFSTEGLYDCGDAGPYKERFSFDDVIATDWEPVIKKETKNVWQWRWLRKSEFTDGYWRISEPLMTEDEARDFFVKGAKYEKHAGPFEVEV